MFLILTKQNRLHYEKVSLNVDIATTPYGGLQQVE